MRQAVFDGRAPELSRIAQRATECCGQPVSATESSEAIKGDLYDVHGHLAFACEPSQRLRIHAYRPGAVRRFVDEVSGGTPLPLSIQGLNEPVGSQSVSLRSYVGQDLTLLFVTLIALEALGGRLDRPLSPEEWREYGRQLTGEELRKRFKATARRGWAAVAVGAVVSPILVAFTVLEFVVTAPWVLSKAIREMRKRRGGAPPSA